MNHLNNLISTFTIGEQHSFIQYLQKKNKRKDAKNIRLFKLLIGNHTDTKEICLKLYQKENRVAYHALRKRLYEAIIDFIANRNLKDENTVEFQIIKYTITARNFFLKKQYHIALKILEKAETLAQEHFLFSLLNEIYHTQIQYAYINPSVNTDEIIEKFDQNIKSLLAEEQLNIVYAKIRNEVNQIRFSGNTLDFNAFFFKTLEVHNISVDDSLTFKSLYQLITIGSLTASVTKKYNEIEFFLEDTYQKIKNHQHRQKQLYYHIQILYHLANMYFRNQKFDKAFDYLDRMEAEMKERHKKYETVFRIKHQNLTALCYNFSGKIDSAISIAEHNLRIKHQDKEALLFLKLSLGMYYFQNKDINKAIKLFSSFYHVDNWYEEKVGKEWIIKKNIIEILLHIENESIDLTSSRILSFKRKYFSYLKESGLDRVVTFVLLVEELFKKPEIAKTTEFYEKVQRSFVFVENRKEDIFVISFYAWLKAKITASELYVTTLDMINRV